MFCEKYKSSPCLPGTGLNNLQTLIVCVTSCTCRTLCQPTSLCSCGNPDGADGHRPGGGAFRVTEAGEPAPGIGAAKQGDAGQAAGAGGSEPRSHQGHHCRPGGQDCQPGGAARPGSQVSAAALPAFTSL